MARAGYLEEEGYGWWGMSLGGDQFTGNQRWDELCEHMKAGVKAMEAHGVQFGGCGECGSAWLECGKCKGEDLLGGPDFPLTIELAHDVFDRSVDK